jgi:uncharacterized Zn-finger protein
MSDDTHVRRFFLPQAQTESSAFTPGQITHPVFQQYPPMANNSPVVWGQNGHGHIYSQTVVPIPMASYSVQRSFQANQAVPMPFLQFNPRDSFLSTSNSSADGIRFGNTDSSDNVFQKCIRISTTKPEPVDIAHPPPRSSPTSGNFESDDGEESESKQVIQPLDPTVTAAEDLAYLSRAHGCEFCNKRFERPKHLKRHLETHSENKRFECRECGKKFRRRDNLLSHSRIHSGETPYACSICDKKFRHQSACINHKRTHSHVKTFQCHLCLTSFGRKSSLKRHIQGIHKDQDQLTVNDESIGDSNGMH